MHYHWNLDNYSNFKVFEVNRLQPRSYFIPYPNKEAAEGVSLLDYRYKSPNVIVLNGEWDFKYFKNPNDFPDIGNLEDIEWEKIDVPSCIQSRGYDIPYYTNVKYQFPINPPKIPTTKPVGWYFGISLANPTHIHAEIHNVKDTYNFICVYHRELEIDDLDKAYTLKFFGVSNNFDLLINEKFVGYAEGSHEISEFNILPYLKKGKNDIVVVMHRWCNGTYLEDQDMFRFNGIFRDVVLFKENKARIWDINFKSTRSKKNKDQFTYTVSVDTLHAEDCKIRMTLSGHNELLKEFRQARETTTFIGAITPKLWNAEEPNLYLLEIELVDKKGNVLEYIKKNVGFKHVEIIDDVFYLNDAKVKLHGVNHHDTNPKNGYTMSPKDIEKDIKLCKEYAVNTIRTSHYPPDPLLIELADLYGIYIVAEADIETHGMNPYTSRSVSGRISHNLKWVDHFLDRAKRLYEPLKADPSIIMWSLGNECGGSNCHFEMYKYFKSVSDLPVHLESAIHMPFVHFDVTSMMYPSIPLIHQVGSKTLKKNKHNLKMMETPFFMCEYAHAMGVGPGCLEEYYDEVLQYDSLMGGCIWEFCDHAVYHEDGPITYTYGGDHGEYFHDGNFCADGLFYPDREPSTGALSMKYVYRPLRFKYLGNKQIEVFNTNNFIDATHYDVKMELVSNNKTIKVFTPKLTTAPFAKEFISFDELKEEGDTFLNIHVVEKDKKDTFFDEQLIIHQNLTPVIIKEGNLTVDNASLTVKGDNFSLAFDKDKGGIKSYNFKGNELIKDSSDHSLVRVKLDNDSYEAILWNLTGMTKLKSHLKNINMTQNGDVVNVKATTKLSHFLKSFTIDDEYTIHGDGVVEVKSLLHKKGKTVLPRFATIYHLNDDMKKIAYLARKDESYVDIEKQSPITLTNNTIENMIEPNLRPQESGNRTQARFALINNGKVGLRFTAVSNPFEFSLKEMTDAELLKMTHRDDLSKFHESHFTIAAFNMGVGTGICGPVALPQYRYLSDKDYLLAYTISPVSEVKEFNPVQATNKAVKVEVEIDSKAEDDIEVPVEKKNTVTKPVEKKEVVVEEKPVEEKKTAKKTATKKSSKK